VEKEVAAMAMVAVATVRGVAVTEGTTPRKQWGTLRRWI
jgi:hypothetical protein